MNPFFNLAFSIKGFLVMMLLFCHTTRVFSQIKIEDKIDEYYTEKVVSKKDTSYVDFATKNWSLRAFANIKDHSFQLKNSMSKINYTPNNRFGVGVGIAYFPVVLDIGFNVKAGQNEPTDRFDLQAKVLLGANYLGLVVQDYKGFNVRSSDMENSLFREDIRSSTINLTYAYVFNSNRVSIGAVFSGSQIQKKNVGSFLLGGFMIYHRMNADSSIIPSNQQKLFGELSGLSSSNSIGGGIVGGYGHIFILPHNLFLFFNLSPGIGLVKKQFGTDSSSYESSYPLLYRLNFNLSCGYNGPGFYILLTAGDDISLTSFDSSNKGALNIGMSKLIFGYKFRKR